MGGLSRVDPMGAGVCIDKEEEIGVGVGVGIKFPVCDSESRVFPSALPTHRQHHADSEARPSQTSSDGRSHERSANRYVGKYSTIRSARKLADVCILLARLHRPESVRHLPVRRQERKKKRVRTRTDAMSV